MWPFKKTETPVPTERDENFTQFIKDQEEIKRREAESFQKTIELRERLDEPFRETVAGLEKVARLNTQASGHLDAVTDMIADVHTDLASIEPKPKTVEVAPVEIKKLGRTNLNIRIK